MDIYICTYIHIKSVYTGMHERTYYVYRRVHVEVVRMLVQINCVSECICVDVQTSVPPRRLFPFPSFALSYRCIRAYVHKYIKRLFLEIINKKCFLSYRCVDLCIHRYSYSYMSFLICSYHHTLHVSYMYHTLYVYMFFVSCMSYINILHV